MNRMRSIACVPKPVIYPSFEDVNEKTFYAAGSYHGGTVSVPLSFPQLPSLNKHFLLGDRVECIKLHFSSLKMKD